MPSTALVTGATSGIGRAVAAQLAERGMHVVLTGRNTERGEAAVQAIRDAGGTAHFVRADVRDKATADDLVGQATRAAEAEIDVLVNSAGIFPFGPTEDTTEETFDDVYAVNVRAPYFLVAALAPRMAERGEGAIVNITTMVADFGMAGMALYGSSKAAVELLTKAWAAEYGPRGVRVNAVSPGPTRTEGTAAMGENLDALAAAGPAGRPGTPDEIAAAVVFLAEPAAAFVHGVVLPVDGGRRAV